jgi:hypothetical protein
LGRQLRCIAGGVAGLRGGSVLKSLISPPILQGGRQTGTSSPTETSTLRLRSADSLWRVSLRSLQPPETSNHHCMWSSLLNGGKRRKTAAPIQILPARAAHVAPPKELCLDSQVASYHRLPTHPASQNSINAAVSIQTFAMSPHFGRLACTVACEGSISQIGLGQLRQLELAALERTTEPL